MKIGIGYRNIKSAFLAGKDMAETAIRKGEIDRPDLVIAFNSGGINSEKFFRGGGP